MVILLFLSQFLWYIKIHCFFNPFYYSHGNFSFKDIRNWVFYTYFSILDGIILAVYLFVKNRQYTTQQKENIKKLVKEILALMGAILCINIGESVYISFKVDNMIKASYRSYRQVNTFSDAISDLSFYHMNYLNGYYKN